MKLLKKERRLRGNSGRLRNVAYVVNDGDDVNKTDVFILLAEGMPVKDICELLGCSEFTIQEMLDEVVSMGTLFKNRQHLENFRVLYQQAGAVAITLLRYIFCRRLSICKRMFQGALALGMWTCLR